MQILHFVKNQKFHSNGSQNDDVNFKNCKNDAKYYCSERNEDLKQLKLKHKGKFTMLGLAGK